MFNSPVAKYQGLVLEESTGVCVTGNVFSGLTTDAISLRGAPSRRVVFTGNVLTDGLAAPDFAR